LHTGSNYLVSSPKLGQNVGCVGVVLMRKGQTPKEMAVGLVHLLSGTLSAYSAWRRDWLPTVSHLLKTWQYGG